MRKLATTPHKVPRPHEDEAKQAPPAAAAAEQAPPPASPYGLRSKDKPAAAAAAVKEEEGKEGGAAPAAHPPAPKAKAAPAAASPVKKEEEEEAPAEEPSHKKAKTSVAPEHHPAGLAIDRPLHARLETSPAPGTKVAPTILERGRIVFMYDATRGGEASGVASLADVRHFFIALVPASDSDSAANEAGVEDWHAKARLLIVGRKRLPSSIGERFWGFVDAVADTYDGLFKKKKAAAAEEGGGAGAEDTPAPSSPKKGGAARKPGPGEGAPAAADAKLRVVAEGDYAISRVGAAAGTGHLMWVLSEPVEPGSACAVFGLESASRFVVSVKNPLSASGQGLGLQPKARFSDDAQAAFKGKTGRALAWVNATIDSDLLCTPRAEFIFIKAKDAAERDPALTTSLAEAAAEDHADRVAAAEAEAKGAGGEAARAYEETLAALQEELHARALGLDVRPMVTGELE